jgi:hypothetical protein
VGRKISFLFVALCLLIASGLSVSAGEERERGDVPREARSGPVDTAVETNSPDHGQHGNADEHLPGKQNNVELLSTLKLTETPGGIADVHYYKNYAYLAAWAPECPNGGVHVVDVHDPKNPVKVGFIPAGDHDYVGEGVHAIHVENKSFTGDILLVNHEACDLQGREGISLWDVTDPTDPRPLALHTGDFDISGRPFANSVHSVMGFTQNGGSKAYAVLVDNYEAGSTDVDIMDISKPRKPELVSETGLPDWPGAEVDANGENAFHHDMWFKRIDGIDTLGVSYWDAGWVFLNVNDPANPQFIYDTNYPSTDLAGQSPPEGNAHQGEWNHNSRFWLGTDEDFSPFRSTFEIITGPNTGDFPGAEFGWTVPIVQNFDGDKAEGTTVWGGTGCPEDVDGDGTSDRDEVPDAADYDAEYSEGEERILILTRGVCFFSEKVESGELHGWDMVVIGNHHAGSGAGTFPDAHFCGSKGHEYDPTISAGCTGHRAMHLIFGDTPEYGTQPYEGSDLPAIGTVGEDVRMTSIFDGWGYLNLYNYRTGEWVDAYAAPQALDRDHAFGSGTMSIHEIETDRRPGMNLGYIAWYSIGVKVVRFGASGIESLGVYRHEEGNDFWGVSLKHSGDKRPIIFMSDRDSGLWVFKYTGEE